MSRERWGTFSVADHLQPRAFVAEVMLYDRLVVPYPPTQEERQKWTEHSWEPGLLQRKLDILGEDIVMRAPWDEWRQRAYQSRIAIARGVNFDGKIVVEAQSKVDAYYMTRTVLALDCRPELPRGITKVWAMAAYPSVFAYQEDTAQATDEEKREKLAIVLTHQFLVPENPDLSDDEMLKQAVELARRDDFREKRATLNRWQEDIIEQDIPPDKAAEEMEEYLRQYNNVVQKAHR